MLLSNGKDAVLVDYSGSMFGAINGHSHFEPHQGTPCGWYKVANAWKTPTKGIQSVVACGYQIIMNGEVCEPKNFCQEFDPKRATLSTKIMSFGGCELLLESFLNDESVLVERYKFIKVPENRDVDLTLLLFKPDSMASAVGLRTEPEFSVEETFTLNSMGFSYRIGEINGYGAMYCDKPGDSITNWAWTKGFIFKNVRDGWAVTRYLAVSDSTETTEFKEKTQVLISTFSKMGFEKVKAAHINAWEKYSETSNISIPDKEFEHIYNLCRYIVRAHLHPENGGITVGMLSNLWGGGTYVPCDAWYLHQSLLLTNNAHYADKHLDYYVMQYEKALKAAVEFGLSGAAFSGWTTCFGEHKGNNIKDYLLHLKPCMAGFIALAFYWQWKYTGTLSAEKKNILKDLLRFSREFIVDKGELAEIAPCMAANESATDVKNDSFTSIVFTRAFAGAAEIFGDDDLNEVSRKLYRGLMQNYENGFLQPFPGAWYSTGLHLDYFLFNLPEGIDRSNIYNVLELCQTHWGYNFEQPSEFYRDWPWIASRAAICLANMKDPEKAFNALLHQTKFASSLGALPEKIRLDGYPIGYWYSTPHGLFIWAMIATLVNVGPSGELRLLWGMDGEWKDLSFRDLRVPGGIAVSASVTDGKITELKVVSPGGEAKDIPLDINPLYASSGMPLQIHLDGENIFFWSC